jgi:magnesium transporter
MAYVLDHIRRYGHDSETLSIVYVIDERGRLIGEIPIRKILLLPPDTRVAEVMDERVIALKATDSQESAVPLFQQEDRVALPVTDFPRHAHRHRHRRRRPGRRADRRHPDSPAVRRPGGAGGALPRDAVPLDGAAAGGLARRALPREMLTATAMAFFEKEIQRAVVLALFVPLIISSGGNSGSQAATLVIRALALGEVTLRQWWRVMHREVWSGLALGSILGAIGFLRIAVWSQFTDLYGPHWLLVAVTVGIALVGIVLWGTLAGSMLPFVLRRLGFDPAASSAPFVATWST